MVWVLCFSAVALVFLLAWLFVKSARAIRRDVDARFQHVQAQLEQDASNVLRDLLKEREQG